MTGWPHFHHVGGRLRVKSPAVKGSRSCAAEVEQRLAALEGVRSVRANPVTGSVLIHFDSTQITHRQLLAALEAGCELCAVSALSPATRAAARSVVKLALKELAQGLL